MQFIDLKSQQARIEKQINQRIQNVLAHGKYIMGPEVFELEAQLADYVGLALYQKFQWNRCTVNGKNALGIKPGDEVNTPLTWISTVETIELLVQKQCLYIDKYLQYRRQFDGGSHH